MQTIRGIHGVREALTGRPERVRRIVVASGRLDRRLAELVTLARRHGVPVYREPRASFALRRREGPDQGVLAELSEFQWRDLDELLEAAAEPAFFLVLDRVEDPRNFGAVVRAADGAGTHGIVVPERGTAPPSEAAVSASAGALLSAPCARVTNVSDCLEKLKKRGIWTVGLAPEAPQPWYRFDFTSPVAVVLGSEGKGLRRRVAATCDALVSLPQAGQVASLNLSVAAGIVLYEVVRQRAVAAR
jgi:23S rRNA (guanosine2251-2'-O)-methyltransferase